MNELFVNKANRDRLAKRLTSEGKTVRRFRVLNQLLDPKYVRDYEGTSEDYRTPFAVLYSLQVIEGVGV